MPSRVSARLCALSIPVLLSITSCGGSSGGSTTAPAPTVTAPTLTTANTMIYIGQSVQFAATGGGTIRWGGDNPQVATVDQTTGRVTGVGNGRVTIWAENEGGRTTRLLRGLPSFAGNWVGNWVVEGCTQNGVYALLDACSGHPNGSSRSLAINLSQTEDRVASGAIAFGGSTGTTTAGTVSEDGELRLTAALTPIPGNSVRINVDNIVLRSPAAGNIQGSLEQVWGFTDVSGTMRVFARVANLTRTSGGPTLTFNPPAAVGPTYADVLRLMR